MQKRKIIVLSLVCLIMFCVISGQVAPPKVEIELKTWDPPGTILEKSGYLEEFHKIHPNIMVKVEVLPVESLSQKFIASFLAKESQDLIYYSDGLSDWISIRAIKDLNKYLSKKNRDDFYPSALKMFAVNGKQYGIPVDVRVAALIYNKRLFREAGLDPEKPPQTMDELLKYAQLLTKSDLNQYGFGMVANSALDPQVWIQLGTFIPAWGGKFFNDNFSKVLINNKEAVAALQFWVDLYRKYKVCPPSAINDGDTEMIPQFCNEHIAMISTGPWIFDYINRLNPDLMKHGDLGVALNPLMKKRGTVLFGSSIQMASNTKHPKECWEFIEWFTSTEIMARFCRALPARKSVLNHSAGQKFNSNEYKSFMEMLAEGDFLTTPYGLPNFIAMRKILCTELQNCLLGKKDVQAAMNDVTLQTIDLLKQKSKI